MAALDQEIADLVVNYDPERPQARYASYGATEMAALDITARLPTAIPWPNGREPKAVPLSPAPADDIALDAVVRRAGWDRVDAVVVTWTSAEAAAMAALLTPGYAVSQWYEYRHDVASYIPLVAGERAPFNDTQTDMTRYYHSMGLYFLCQIAEKNVVLVKSGLHLDFDGPHVPVRRLMTELATTLRPKVFITTGTGGGINGSVQGSPSVTQLGDVVVGLQTVFDCQTQFRTAAWLPPAGHGTATSPFTQNARDLITPALVSVNASKVPGGRAIPEVWNDANIVTTDFFGFADTRNTYGLAGKGRACDMGDAMVGLAISDARKSDGLATMQWHAIRNASDPEMNDEHVSLDDAKKQAAGIYVKYGALTTAASVIASWAVIASL